MTIDGEAFCSSRIIVKNLPKKIAEDRIKGHFGTRGQITDVKLAHTQSGVFRRFAYIGYSSDKEAQNAVAYFNNTFIDTSRIQVELARPANDPNLPRPWSKYSTGSSSFAKKQDLESAALQANASKLDKEALKTDLAKKRKFLLSIYGEEGNGELETYLKAMKSKSTTKTWENDDDDLQTAWDQISTKKKSKAPVKSVQVSTVPSKKTGGSGILLPKAHVKFTDGNDSDELYEELPAKATHDSEVEFISTVNTDSDDEETNQTKLDRSQMTGETKQAKTLDPAIIAETGRLFVRNLSFSCSEDSLRALFEPFGPLSEVHVPISKETKQGKGFAYILFMIPENAVQAYTKLDGSIFEGRLLHILPALDKPSTNISEQDATSSFKAKKSKELKESSTKDFNWNSLFIRSDTVLDAIAANLGVPKASIMDVRSDNLATRLAIAETHLIQEAKNYLENEGVCLDAFTDAGNTVRSNTIILIKNLPFDTEISDIRSLFSKFGHIDRIILPPSTKAIALVEFLETSEARTAFNNLAYSKFKSVPLYLEWAPMACLKVKTEALESTNNVDNGVIKKPESAKEILQSDNGNAEMEQNHLVTHTLYVSNINFSTTMDTLKQVFSSAGPIRAVTLPTKMRNNQKLFLGFGFIEFENKNSLNRAFDKLQGVNVDGHALVLKHAIGTTNPTAQSETVKKSQKPIVKSSDPTATKLIIRNIPFEASEKEVKDLFKSFVQVKRLRIPKKFNGQHRGFGFIEFLTHQEATNAFAQLAHTHLYGRHLVLEWAKTDSEDLDEMRQKAVGDVARLTSAKKSSKTGKISLDQGDDDIIDDTIESDSEDETN